MQKGIVGILILMVVVTAALGGIVYWRYPSPQPSSDKPLPSSTTFNETKCVAGGCSGQLCVEVIEGQEDQAPLVSTCEYREEYGCYRSAKCERQKDGKCDWTQTEALIQCKKEKSALDTRDKR